MIHGRGSGLEIVLAGPSFDEGFGELRSRLGEGTDFYRGTHASVVFGTTPDGEQLARVRALLDGVGMVWEGAYGEPGLEQLLASLSISYLGAAPHPAVAPLPSRERPARQVELSENARSLVADFAGARADLAQRRHRGPRRRPEPVPAAPGAPVLVERAAVPEPATSVLYHRGTLRGGQALANLGHIIVIGDVNPGAELVAGGDIVVFGQLRGVAHAGAQGDRSARVYALGLAPTQLRIATTIAAGDERPNAAVPEEAFLEGDRIAIVPAGEPPRRSSERAASERSR